MSETDRPTAPIPDGVLPEPEPERTTMSGRKLVGARFEILDRLGEGGMGLVYEALDHELDQTIAIKVLSGRTDVDQLKDELRIARTVSHKNVVRIHDFGVDGDDVFISMELLEGGTLEQRLQPSGMPWEEGLIIAKQIAAGLAAAHETGVVHRDLKPQNVLFTKDGVPKLADFGIALSQHSDDETGLVGTPHFMSPEQIRSEPLTAASDVYAFGVLMYQMFTGTLPFQHSKLPELLKAHLNEVPPPPDALRRDLPGPINDVIVKCLQKQPDARFASAEELHEALQHIIEVSLRDAVDRLRPKSALARVARALALRVSRPVATRWLMVLAFLLGTTTALLGLGDGFSMSLYDQVIRLMQPTVHQDVVPVVIDDNAVDVLGRPPWIRTQYGEIFNQLSDDGADVIADLMFRGTTPEDGAFLEQLKGRNYTMEFAYRPVSGSTSKGNEALQAFAKHEQKLPPASHMGGVPVAHELILPKAEFVEAAGHMGIVNAERDRDGVLRRIPMVVRYRSRYLLSLPLVAAANRLDVPTQAIRVEPSEIVLPNTSLGRDVRIPIDERGHLWVPFADPRWVSRSTSVLEVEGKAQDKIAIVLAFYSGSTDFYTTPRSRAYAGGFILCEALSAILSESAIRPIRFWAILAGVAALLVAMLLIAPRPEAALTALFGAALAVTVSGALLTRLVWIDPQLPVAFLVYAAALLLGRRELLRWLKSRY